MKKRGMMIFKKKSFVINFFFFMIFFNCFSIHGADNTRSISDVKMKGIDQQNHVVKGKVTDENGATLPGVTIIIVGSTKGVITDTDGFYSIEVASTDELEFSFVGMETHRVKVENNTTLNIVLREKVDELEEVQIVAFGKQKKESVISSISTIRPSELKVPSSNLTTALAGRIAGVISYQRSGEPGSDNAEFFVRGVTTFGYTKSPLILLDGLEVSSSDL